MKLALFDFDGTITNQDSMMDFLQYSFGKYRLFQALVTTSPYLLFYKLGLYPNNRAKERLLTKFFRDMPSGIFEELAFDYSVKKLPSIVRKNAIEKIQWHQSQGHDVLVVSAAIEAWLKPWCKLMKLQLLSSQMEVKNGLMTGRLSETNCYGQQKVNRIKQYCDLRQYKTIYAYGDSKGDKEMLALANEAYFRCFS